MFIVCSKKQFVYLGCLGSKLFCVFHSLQIFFRPHVAATMLPEKPHKAFCLICIWRNEMVGDIGVNGKIGWWSSAHFAAAGNDRQLYCCPCFGSTLK